MVSSIGLGLTLRKMTSGLTKGATGNKLLLLNFFVAAAASGSANFFNGLCMRYTEINKGISVYSDPDMNEEIGVSSVAAKKAVYITAGSRVAMSAISQSIPVAMMITMRGIGMSPKAKGPKTALELGTIGCGLYLGLPYSVAMFPSESVMAGKEAEDKFHKFDYIYYNRGK